ncbi:MAG: ThuA domain-containing protein [Phycisphaeraceae bacterium]
MRYARPFAFLAACGFALAIYLTAHANDKPQPEPKADEAPAARAALVAKPPAPLRVLLVTGGCCHDYNGQKAVLADGLKKRANVEVTTVHDMEKEAGGTKHFVSIYKKDKWWDGYDVVIHNECYADVKDKPFVDGILAAHKDAGVPAINLHCAMHCYRVDFNKYKDWFEFTGVDTRRHGPQQPIDIDFIKKDHPIVKGMENWTTINEELYQIEQTFENVTVLATGTNKAQGKNDLIWINTFGPKNTRVFSTTLGHNTKTMADDRYLDLLTRGVLWACNKLNDDGTPMKGYGK